MNLILFLCINLNGVITYLNITQYFVIIYKIIINIIYFQALSDLAKSVSIDYNLPGTEKYEEPTNVVTRGLLKK